MFTPGQLIRHQRLRRGWTQGELAEAAGVGQGALSRYETEIQSPSWVTLCRVLGAMGMQPRVMAEPGDLSQHLASALARRDADDRELFGVSPAWRDEEIDLEALLGPDVSETPLRLYHLLPLLDVLRGLTFVLVGRIAMRLHGLGCSVPRVDVVVDAQPGPELWSDLARRLEDGSLAVWSPELARYRWTPDPVTLTDIAAWTTTTESRQAWLSLRTADTATEIRLQIRPGDLPPHVMGGTRETPVPLLAISELAGSDHPELRQAFQRIAERGPH